MRQYYRIGPSIWEQGWSDDELVVAFYLLTNRHRITEGLYRLPVGYAIEDLPGGWTPRRFERAMGKLVADDFCDYDERASVVLVVKALVWQAPQNINQVTHAVKKLATVPPTVLARRFARLAEAHCERLAKALRERFPEWFVEPSPEPLGQGIGDPPSPSPSRTLKQGSTHEVEGRPTVEPSVLRRVS